MTKKQKQELITWFSNLVTNLGASKSKVDIYTIYVLNTKYGILKCRLDIEDNMVSVFAKFLDVVSYDMQLHTDSTNINHTNYLGLVPLSLFTGKWNLHLSNKDTSIEQAKERITTMFSVFKESK